MSVLTRIADKTGVAGSIVATMSCALCFPAAASIGAAIGLGFLAQWEPLFLRVLPLFAVIALLANGLGGVSHRQWHRSVLGMIGPTMVLIGWYAFTNGLLDKTTARGVLYTGLVVMLAVAVWDLVSPANRRCVPKRSKAPLEDR